MPTALQVVEKTGVAKVITENGPLWCHVSRKNDTVKCRRYAEGNVFEVPDWDTIETFVPLSECQKHLKKQTSYSYKNVMFWSQILDQLEAGTLNTTAARSSESKEQGPQIPETRLRRYYRCIHEFDKALMVGLADFYQNNVKALEKLWNDSRKRFDVYENHAGWGQGKRKDLPSPPRHLREIKSTNVFTAFVKQAMKDGDFQGFTFVEREINPMRARNAVFADGTPATKSGKGGIDLLLASNSTPVVGEVKVKRDKNVFFALLQAMTYAVELSTPKQMSRLRKHFPDSFQNLDLAGGKVNIALFLVNPVKDPTRKPVENLITQLNKNGKCKGLGRIELLWNDGEVWHRHA